MAIGDILDSLNRIRDLEEEIERINNYPHEYAHPGDKKNEIYLLIGLERGRDINE
jgi:hypothetical protein